MSTLINRIGVFTSGGDAPGMNACVRAIVRVATARDIEVIGIRRGYTGMIEGDFVEMDRHSVSNLLQQGGTILKSDRCEAFRTKEGRQQAADQLKAAGIDAIVAIGGNGTFTGAVVFDEEHGVPVVGCPGTIDNDLFGTDETIGYDTALNTALESIDRIRDTADAHNRLFLIEVMGRDAGFIALNCGIGGGAEMIIIPETVTSIKEVKKHILSIMTSHRRSSIAVVAEGDDFGGAVRIADALKEDENFSDIDLRVCILGHTQRGGSPSARDRVLASRLGAAAVEALLQGHTGVMAGLVAGKVKLTPIKLACRKKKKIDYELIKLSKLLS